MPSLNNKKPILLFLCNWAPYRCYMELLRTDAALQHLIYPVKVMCAGRIDPAMILYAFEKGAAGVMAIGCRDEECLHGCGPRQSAKNAEQIKALIHILGLKAERFRTVGYAFNEKDRMLEEIDSFAQAISKLKLSPFAPQRTSIESE